MKPFVIKKKMIGAAMRKRKSWEAKMRITRGKYKEKKDVQVSEMEKTTQTRVDERDSTILYISTELQLKEQLIIE